jgi:hypothetical protein
MKRAVFGIPYILLIVYLVTLLYGCAKPKDGHDGAQGPPGSTGKAGLTGPAGNDGEGAVIEVITPCPGIPGNYPEVLWRITGGKLYAVYASGQNIHLTEVIPGHYVTTDGRNCYFSVTQDLQIQYP